MTLQTFEPDGRAIPFVEEGEGPVAVVVLPGRGLNIESLGALAHFLEEEGFHLIRIGVRTAFTDGVTMHDLAQDVVDVLDHVGLGTAFIAGHAFGGAVARTVALDRPERAEGLILLGVESADQAGDAAQIPDAFADASAVGVQAAALAATPVEEWAAIADTFGVLVVQGSDDVVTPPANAEQLRASASDRVSVVTVDGGGHLFVLTHPGEIGAEVEEYLAWD
jgi:pimeloyl-ACP methyl ester carboxylesterase